MRRHIVLIALILGIAFLVYKFESVSREAHARPVAIDEGITLEPTPRPQFPKGDRISAARAALSPTPVADSSDADQKCWEQINDQLRTNGYVDSIRPKLNTIVGPWFYAEEKPELKQDETSKPGRFFQALAEAGLLDGRTLEPNHVHALKLLTDLAEEDRSNSAPLLFAATLAEKNGDKATADRLFAEAKTRPKFNVYVTEFTRAVVTDMQTVSDWFEAVAVNSRIPVPQMGELAKMLKTRDSSSIAVTMINNYPFAKEKPVQEIDYFPLEYAFGISVLKAVDAQSVSLFPTFKSILHMSLENAAEGELNGFWTEPSKFACDLHVLEPMLTAYQARLRSAE